MEPRLSGRIASLVSVSRACGVIVRHARLSLIGLACLALAVLPLQANAFDVDRTATGTIQRLPHMPVAVYWRAQKLGTLSIEQVEDALVAAMATWNAVPGADVELAFGGRVTKAPAFDIYVMFDDQFGPGAGGDPSGRTVRVEAGGQVSRIEIALNTKDYLFTTQAMSFLNTDKLVADLQGAFTHQLGHALGLGHSREALAAMYFYRVDSASRVLAPDDLAGARWLWPKTSGTAALAEGGQCDACNSDQDCAQGHCYTWPNGSAHCLLPCSVHADCPLTTSCGATADGLACLPNDSHCHVDSAKSGFGGLCFGDLQCPSDNICMTGGKYGWCSSSCMSACANGSCQEHVCRAAGSLPMGAPCLVPSACQPGVGGPATCAGSLTQGGACSQTCGVTKQCPVGSKCSPDGTCAQPGPWPVGWPCESGFDCQSSQCVVTPGGRFAASCTIACTVATDCPAGTGCSTIDGEQWCLPYGPAVVGSACLKPGMCGGKLVCDMDPVLGVGACSSGCDPFGEGAECQGGQRCAWVAPGASTSGGAATKATGVCRGSGGGALPGQACGTTQGCRVDLACSAASGGPPTCRTVCDLASGAGCSGGQACAPLQDGPVTAHGVCADDAKVQVSVPLAVAPGANFAAQSMSLNDVVLSSHFKGVVVDDSTCTARRTASGRGALTALALVALAIAVLRRRRIGG